MKIVSLTGSVSRSAGGLFDAVRQLHLSLAGLADVEANVFGLRDEFTDADALQWNPINVRAFDIHGPNQFGYAPQMQRVLLNMDVDVLHTHGIWMYPSMVSLAWHQRSRRPYVVSPHGMISGWAIKNSGWKKSLALRVFERKHLEGAGCLRALCRSEAESMRAMGLNNPICIIPNGIDLPEALQVARVAARSIELEAGGWRVKSVANGRKVLLFLGRIHPKKGLVNLLTAWARVCRSAAGTGKANDWILAIAGWDQNGHEAEIKKLSSGLGIEWADLREPEVRNRESLDLVFLGPQWTASKAALYAGCDAFILPSFSEGLPITILEAWAYGKPALMTPECNLDEGFAANAAVRISSDEHGIETGLLKLFSMPHGVLQAMGDNGRRLVAERFAWSRVARDMKAVYDWLLGTEPKPDCIVTE